MNQRLMLKNIVMLQARMESTRLPGKVLMPINGRPMIEWQILRIMRAKFIDGLVVVIPDTTPNDYLNKFLRNLGINVFRGSLNNVFDRFLKASIEFSSESIIRLTADCPLIMPDMIDEMVNYFDLVKPDYLCNALEENLPDGLDIEIFRTQILKDLNATSNLSKAEKEHVTLRMWENPDLFHIANFPHAYKLGDERWTVDYVEDFHFVSEIFGYFGEQAINIQIEDILDFIKSHPDKVNKQSSKFRNIALKNLENES